MYCPCSTLVCLSCLVIIDKMSQIKTVIALVYLFYSGKTNLTVSQDSHNNKAHKGFKISQKVFF